MTQKKQTPTAVSAVTAITVAATLATSGRYIEAGIAGVIGVGLFVAYHHFQYQDLSIDEETIEMISGRGADLIEDAQDEYVDNKEE